ncbi:hypothetical protein [Streptomyces sp. NPDC127119]|uniref:hypothetical protein n=1 Tax=Streptomyces sp. NPDC127119 TaxID=3345370 RepID=UPI00362DF4D0
MIDGGQLGLALGIGVEPDNHGFGRSRGGLTTKLHLDFEQGHKPVSIVITAGSGAILRSSSQP